MATVAANLVEQRAIDRGHDQAGTLSASVLLREEGERAIVVLRGPLGLKSHESAERLSVTSVENVSSGYTETRKLVHRQVDAIVACVLADVADDVGELQCGAQRLGIAQRLRVDVTEDPGGDQADDAGDVIAIMLELSEVGVPR